MIEVAGWDPSQVYYEGTGRNVFLTFGCSWSRAWGSEPGELYPSNPEYQENTKFLKEKSFAALVANHLGISHRINFAIPGSNNDTQHRLIVEFIERNRNQFDRIFVLWGLTSIYRWELYCNRIDAPWSYMWGTDVPITERKELEYYFKNHWEKSYQLNQLSNKILTTSSYLKLNQVEHLFFPVFQSYNRHNMLLNTIDPSALFGINLYNNDMLSLMCEKEKFDSIDDFLSDAHNNDERLKSLIQLGYLSERHAHPTEKGHQFIANHLIEWLQKNFS